MAATNDKDWAGDAKNASPDGEFIRDTNYIEDRISSEVSEVTAQEDGTFLWPMEADRYRLIAARACPWAHRAVITRRLMGLENSISLGLAGPTHDIRSWTFDLDEGGVDPVLGITRLRMPISTASPSTHAASLFQQSWRNLPSALSLTTTLPSSMTSSRNGPSSKPQVRQTSTPRSTRLKWKR